MNASRTPFVSVHVPCPCGRSSDAYCIREDGSGMCFSCGENFSSKETKTLAEESTEESVESVESIEYVIKGLRGISKRTMEFYGVEVKVIDGKDDSVAFPYGPSAAKIRKIERENGKVQAYTQGEFKDAGLFGLDLYDPGSRPAIAVFEGEFDALAGAEMLGNKVACVSIKNGATGAYRDLARTDVYEKVNSFEKIYICFDADKPGQDAVRSIQGLFDFRKVYHVRLGKHKDANEYLLAKDVDDFTKTFFSAKRFAPDNIISSFGDIEKALEESREDQIGTYPFEALNESLYGIHAGEVIVVKAPEGVGKTEFFRALEHHLLKSTNHPIGIIHLEEDNATTIKALAGYHLSVPATLPDCGLSKQDILRAYREAVRDDEGRIHIHSSFDVEDESAFLGNIRFLVAAAGCRFIFLDHVSWLATGLQDEDERKKLDRVTQSLKLLAKELRFALIEISHVNDDGKTRGSRNVSKVANTVISLDRDLLSGSTKMTFTVEKARLGGRTGPAGYAIFDRNTGVLRDNPELGD